MDVDTVYHNPIPLLYQSGYLTIKGFDPESGMMLVSKMLRDIRSGSAESFMQRLESLFAKTSYQIQGDAALFSSNMVRILRILDEKTTP